MRKEHTATMHVLRRTGIRVTIATLAILTALSTTWFALHNEHGPSLHDPPRAHAAATGDLPIPQGLTVRQDDRAAILQWDVDPKRLAAPLPEGVSGYRVTWGPAARPDSFVRLTEYKFIQLQPLVNGQPYVAQVQSVDSYGRLSPFSTQVSFTGDSARVDALRERMNGFFDDFNLAEGAPDELKWNTAYSRCNSEESNAFFINPQFHVHNTVFSGNCDRAQQVNRARAEIDFSDNLTRTIVFDYDGVFRRNRWYVDLVPRLADLTGPEKFFPGGLRIKQSDYDLDIRTIDNNGDEVVIAQTDRKPYPPLDAAGVPLVPNVRRHWEVRVSKTAMEVLVDGVRVLATPPGAFRLTQDRYHVHWVAFSYNTNKGNQMMVLYHWDNFGFDAPAGTRNDTVTHNYKLNNAGSDFLNVARWNDTAPAAANLNIPDEINGARERRLMFTLQTQDNRKYVWSATDRVILNGVGFAIPKPASDTDPPDVSLVTSIRPYQVTIPLPEGVLRKGMNTFVFDLEASGVHNIHVELDFDTATAPSYTQPDRAAGGQVMPKMPEIGPNAIIAQIGSTQIDRYSDQVNDPAKFKPSVSGIVPVTVEVGNDRVLQGTGSNPGVKLVELFVDRQIVASQRTDVMTPAPAATLTFNLDTRKFPNGTHELYVRAYNPDCVPSIADYGVFNGQSGRYLPIYINVRNGTASRAIEASAAPKGTFAVLLPLVSNSAMATSCVVKSKQSVQGHNH